MVAQATKRIDALSIATAAQPDDWTLVAGATKMAAILTDDATTTYIRSAAGNDTVGFDIDTTFSEKFGYVEEVRLVCRHASDAGSDSVSNALHIYTGGVVDRTFGSAPVFTSYNIGGGTSWQTQTQVIARPGGGQWVDADFRTTSTNRFQFVAYHPSQAAQTYITEMYVEVDYIPLNRAIDLEREIASRFLRLRREPEQNVMLVNGWEALEAELMDPIGFSNLQGPTYDGTGWGVVDWERGFGRLKRQSISLSMPNVKSTIGDRRRFQATLWETMKATFSGDPDIADGLARLDSAGAEREFARASVAHGEDAGGVVRQIAAGKERITPSGTLVEGARGNFCLRSSFVESLTGWTKTETTGAATHAVDTTDLLFEPAVSAQSSRLTVTTAPYDIDITPPSTQSLDATTEHVLSLDWKQSVAATQKVAIQNDTTTNWLQSNGTWGASRADLTLGTAVGTVERDQLVFTTESTASAHTVKVQVVGSTNGAIHHAYHLQIEIGGGDGFASSRIVTGSVTATRALDDLSIRNDSSLSQRIWPVDKFTAQIKFTPLWNSVDISDSKVLLELNHDANNSIRLIHFEPGTTDHIFMDYVHAGTTDSAFWAAPRLVRGTEYTLTMRKTSSSGEHGLTANTISVFLDGVKGTDDTVSADLTQASSSFLQFGMEDSLINPAWGYFGEIIVSPIVYSDTEIAAGIA